MKVLFFIPSLNGIGGVERATISLINSLSKLEGMQISLLMFEPFENPLFKLDDNVKVININITNYKYQYFKVVTRTLSALREGVDAFVVVETLSLIFSLIPFFLNKKKIRLIVWEHFNYKNDNGRRTRRWFRVLAAKTADLIVLLTSRDVDEWNKNLKINSKITHIYNISPFSCSDENFKYNTTSKTILAVGRYTKVKGFDRLIEIWTILQRKYQCSDWELKIVGYGEEKVKLQNLISKSGLNNIQLSSTADMGNEYSNASFYCMTSYFEGLPIVLIEAQSFGLPAIAFDIFTGPSEILNDSSGILINDGELEVYADKMFQMILDSKARENMSHKALEGSQRFTEQVIAKQWAASIKAVL